MSIQRQFGSWAAASAPSTPASVRTAPRTARVVGSLLLFSALPVGAGAMRLHELGSGAAITPDNARFVATPLPVVVHILAASLFALLGALQVAPALRERRPRLHRRLGWVLVPCGMLLAVSGLWMQTFAPPPGARHVLLLALRWLFGGALFASLVLGTRDLPGGQPVAASVGSYTRASCPSTTRNRSSRR